MLSNLVNILVFASFLVFENFGHVCSEIWSDTPPFLPPTLPVSSPTLPLMTSLLFFRLHHLTPPSPFNSSLSTIITAHRRKDMGSYNTLEHEIHQLSHTHRKTTLSSPELSIANSSLIKGWDWRSSTTSMQECWLDWSYVDLMQETETTLALLDINTKESCILL